MSWPGDGLRGRLVVLAAVAAAGCDVGFPRWESVLVGSGIEQTEAHDAGPFSAIEVGSAIRLEVAPGPRHRLTVTADDNLLPLVQTTVAGERLSLIVNGACSPRRGVTVRVETPELAELTGCGAATCVVSEIEAKDFQLHLSGASRCELEVHAESLDIRLAGSSHGTIRGIAKRLSADCTGASRLEASDLQSQRAEVQLNGASQAFVDVREQLVAEASGASRLEYSGEPAERQCRADDAADISARKLASADAD